MNQFQELLAPLVGPELAPVLAELVGKAVADLRVVQGDYTSAGVWAAAAGALMLLIKGYRSERLQVVTRGLAERFSWAKYLVWDNLPKPARYGVPLGLGALWAVASGLGGLMSWPGAVTSGLVLGLGAIFSHHGSEGGAVVARGVARVVTKPRAGIVVQDVPTLKPPEE
jgi:hypothetical protein